jgi:hypothetical protein
MKHLLLYTLLLFALFVNAQTYDLDYYLTNANNNSPLINKTQNNNKLIRLDIQRVKSILSKPLVNVEGNLILHLLFLTIMVISYNLFLKVLTHTMVMIYHIIMEGNIRLLFQ